MKLNLLVALGSVMLLAACGGGEASATSNTAAAVATASQSVASAPATSVDLVKAKGLFEGTCAACHGASGKGDGPGAANLDPKPRDFSNKDYMTKLSDTEIRNTIKYGGAIKAMPQMPSHPQFSDADLTSLVTYVRTLSK